MLIFDKDIQKMLTNRSQKRNWNDDDITILIWLLCIYSVITGKNYKDYTDEDWRVIGNLVPGKNTD